MCYDYFVVSVVYSIVYCMSMDCRLTVFRIVMLLQYARHIFSDLLCCCMTLLSVMGTLIQQRSYHGVIWQPFDDVNYHLSVKLIRLWFLVLVGIRVHSIL